MKVTLPVSHFNMISETNMLLSQFAGLRGYGRRCKIRSRK